MKPKMSKSKRQEIEIRECSGNNHRNTLKKEGRLRKNDRQISISTCYSLYPSHVAVIDKAVQQHLFANKSEAVRFCINNSLPMLLENLEKLTNYEVVEFKDRTVKIIRRLE